MNDKWRYRLKKPALMLGVIIILAIAGHMFCRQSARQDLSLDVCTREQKTETAQTTEAKQIATEPETPFVPKTSPSPHTLVASDPLTTSTPYTALATPQPLSSRRLDIRGVPTIAVVDVERLVVAMVPNPEATEMRAKTIQAIQQAIANRAAVYNLTLVLDISGDSLNGVPFVLSASGVFDLTDEVHEELAR